jgi:predicted DCC family thiol-disulfide oxidoreductase YuxK
MDSRPILLFDGHCRFCVAQTARLVRWTGGRIEPLSFREPGVLERFPQVSAADCERAMQLVLPDGRVLAGADAALAALALRPALAPLAALGRLPGLRQALRAGYRVIAANRSFLPGAPLACADEACRVHVAAAGPAHGPLSAPRALVRDLWLRLLGVVLIVAFLSLHAQVLPLLGAHGLLPAAGWTAAAGRAIVDGSVHAWQAPTLFLWIEPTDAALLWGTRIGAALGALLLLGVWPRAVLAAAWALYLSYATIGQDFLSFQWDNLLLEATFLSLFVAPRGLFPRRAPAPRVPGVLLMVWLLFRVHAESGWAKWLGGDPSWRDLSAMSTYWETAPLPTPLAWWAHQFPASIQQLLTAATLAIEGLVPLLLFGPRRARFLAFLVLVPFQVVVAATANYGFFNLLSLGLCLWALDDGHLLAAARRLRLAPGPRPWPAPAPRWLARSALAGALLLALVTAAPFRVYWQEREPGPRSAWEELEAGLRPLRTLNVYQLFVSMTLVRREIVIEGSRDGASWEPYVWRHKPGDPARAPTFVAPHQPRLDFQAWFLCLHGPPRAAWFQRLLELLVSEPALMASLFERTPCGDEAPAWLRYSVWQYRFTSRAERARTGDWWTRDLLAQSSATSAEDVLWKTGDPPPQRKPSSQDSKAAKPSAPR